ncbi:MAG: hypothetical protein IJT13_02435 [Bacteroidaceae bacterium]|nr:hypothetical protein [Bacteroidaceae bacterium]
MKHTLHTLLIIAACTFSIGAGAQTIIDLQNGGKVRSKNINDYKKEDVNIQLRRAKDSVAYNRCLVVALNEAHAGRPDTAEIYLKEALKLRPDAESNHVVYDLLGRIRIYHGDSLKAIDHFSHALRINAAYSPSRIMRATLYQEIGNHAKCIEDCRYLLEYHPEKLTTEEKTNVLSLSIFSHIQLKMYDTAMQHVRELLKLSPQNKEALVLEVLVTERMGRRQAAIEKISTLIHQYPDDAYLYLDRAKMYECENLLDLALLDLQAAQKLNPQQYGIESEIKRLNQLREKRK